jgi:hypothetical protein
VPAPVVPQEAPVSDIKADYELVQRIGTKRAWEVFLVTHPTGFYADLAKAQIEQLNAPPASQPNATVASLTPPQPPVTRESASKEAIAWDKNQGLDRHLPNVFAPQRPAGSRCRQPPGLSSPRFGRCPQDGGRRSLRPPRGEASPHDRAVSADRAI